MRSPLGYCRVGVAAKANGNFTCNRWVREDRFPLRCPTHKDVPLTNMEELGLLLRRVYEPSIRYMQQLPSDLFFRFAPDRVRFAKYTSPPRMAWHVGRQAAYEFPARGPTGVKYGV